MFDVKRGTLVSEKRGVLFLNSGSGSRTPAEVAQLEQSAKESGLEVLHIGPDLKMGTVIREKLERGVKLFVAAGGDGTINHVAQSLVGTDGILGVIPFGTLNHFARDLHIPLEIPASLEVALGGETVQVDVGRVNERYFLNNISLGVYPPFVEHKETLRRYGRWRALPYAVYMTMRHFPHVSITVETEHRMEAIRTHIFMVANNPYDLSQVGIEAPRPSLETGTLAVYWVDHMPKWRFVGMLTRYVRGKADGVSGFQTTRTQQLKVRSRDRRIRLGMDGEVFKMDAPLVIHSVPRSLLVRVPQGTAN